MAPSSDELDHRIQALPQELQDHILDFTLAIEPKRVAIDRNYKPPWQLTINRKTRQRVAKEYYSTSTFTVNVFKKARRWLVAMTQEHRAMIVDVREHRGEFIYVNAGGKEDETECLQDAAEGARTATSMFKRRYRIELQSTALKSPYFIISRCGCSGCQQPRWATQEGEHDEDETSYWVTAQGDYNVTGFDDGDW